MSFVGRIIAGARDLSFGGPLGNLLAGAARLIPSWLPPYGHGDDARGDPRRGTGNGGAIFTSGDLTLMQSTISGNR